MMKTIKIFFLSLLTCLFCQTYSQDSTSTSVNRLTKADSILLDDFNSKLMSALETKDISKFKTLLMTKDKFRAGIEKNLKDTIERKELLDNYNFYWFFLYHSKIRKSIKSFRKILKDGKDKNVIWSEIIFNGIKFSFYQDMPDMKSISERLQFSYKNDNYSIRLSEIILVPDGWYIARLEKKEIFIIK